MRSDEIRARACVCYEDARRNIRNAHECIRDHSLAFVYIAVIARDAAREWRILADRVDACGGAS